MQNQYHDWQSLDFEFDQHYLPHSSSFNSLKLAILLTRVIVTNVFKDSYGIKPNQLKKILNKRIKAASAA